MEFTGERCVLGKTNSYLEKAHLNRYRFAESYVKGKVVLDIACGSGYGASILAREAKRVEGVDISKDSIKYARKHFKSKNIEFFVGDAVKLEFLEPGSFDVIVSFETIEHLIKYKLFLQEIKRVLKKDGTFIVSTPNKKYSSPHSKKPLDPFHYIEFYKEEFFSLLSGYFAHVEMWGQDLQTPSKKIKRLVVNFIPKKIRHKLIPKNVRDVYNSKQTSVSVKKNIEDCQYIIAVCKTAI